MKTVKRVIDKKEAEMELTKKDNQIKSLKKEVAKLKRTIKKLKDSD